ncbi:MULTISPECIES: SsrA-binding protein SmpB [Commensalibacter]|uniref:SsrA-binding protein n=2 Tax=Commensalibacter TaxID=1079922 RepID=W7E146_9PROT|nr:MULTISPECIES: SsrA-binding protein SmpB [Commensalibacter]EUK18754.1 SsrA-binding protein [Commensalibacter papalotli (ex Servin-Garciduenas et al. 2014)]CAI3923938.1 tmRNA-binding protein (SmpB) (PDB:1J1H) (PUBMED:26251518) [Commensalibacter papalotli (ex Botero et al. 2024)]CAI3928165.1 tmRNA-binding protein (SmpB) (PDB:1J1H) (PUBMED:26251518) [Commensalibacter papalotli (ex Botero et al. 2024)]
MAEKKTNSLISFGNVAKNRKATFNYSIIEKIEAGIMLKGPEVKSLRNGRATINEAFAGERDGEIWLFNSYIPEYQGGVLSKFDPKAPRKLLLHQKQINKLLGSITREGMTLVPLDIFFNSRGIAKVSLGLGQGKKKTDKRQAIADRDWKRDKARLLRNKV